MEVNKRCTECRLTPEQSRRLGWKMLWTGLLGMVHVLVVPIQDEVTYYAFEEDDDPHECGLSGSRMEVN